MRTQPVWEPRWLILGERADGSRECVAWRMDETRALTVGHIAARKYARVLVVLVRSVGAARELLRVGVSA